MIFEKIPPNTFIPSPMFINFKENVQPIRSFHTLRLFGSQECIMYVRESILVCLFVTEATHLSVKTGSKQGSYANLRKIKEPLGTLRNPKEN